MKIRFFVTPWRLDKVEQKLSAMEKEGYHLSEVRFPHQFIFTEGNSREVRYVFLYSELKEYGLLHWRSMFLSNEFGGTEFKNHGFLFYEIIQIRKNGSVDQTIEFIAERRAYIYRTFKRRFWTTIFGFCTIIILQVLDYYNTSNVSFLIAAIMLILGIIAGYNFFGMMSTGHSRTGDGDVCWRG